MPLERGVQEYALKAEATPRMLIRALQFAIERQLLQGLRETMRESDALDAKYPSKDANE
jgi:hypothetical protein